MRTTVVANRTGGTGKTTTAQMIALGYEVARTPQKLAAADTAQEGSTSKLGKICGGVLELGIGAPIEALKLRQQDAVAYWDRFGALLTEGGYTVEIGANVVTPIWGWARVSAAGRVLRHRGAAPIVLVVPVKAQAQAIEDAIDLLEMSIRDEEHLPLAARVLVLNEAAGTFESYGSGEDFRKLNEMKQRHGLRIARLPLCASEVWPVMEREYLPVRDLLTMAPEAFESEFGLDAFSASRAHLDLVSWANESLESFRSVGLIPRLTDGAAFQRASDA
jgi:hypothetical protein